MINLLPYKYKKMVHKLSMVKVVAVTFAGILVLALFGTILFFPTLITINSRFSIAQNQIALLEKTGAVASPVDIKEYEQRTNALIAKLAASSETPPTVYVTTIMSVIPSGVVVDGFSFEKTGETPKVSVHGITSNREALQSYIELLEKQPGVGMIDSPISNYVASKNSEFTIIVSFK